DDLPKTVENPAKLDADAPAPFVFGFFAKLLCTAPLAYGKQQFDWEAVNHQENAGISQEALVPILMRDQQALQSAAIGQPGKQGVIISFEPARKRSEVTSWRARTASRWSPTRSDTTSPESAWEPLSSGRRQDKRSG